MAPVQTTTVSDLAADPAVRAEAGSVVESLGDRLVERLLLTADDGTTVELPEHLTALVTTLLRSVADGSTIATLSLPPELTTTTAAAQLGISRPTLMKWIAAGKVPAHRVGAHTRLLRDDVLELRDRLIEGRRRAADELLAAGEPFD